MLSVRHAAASALRWRPTTSYSNMTARRFAGEVQVQTDFGKSMPPGRPEGYTGLYVTEPKARPGSFGRYLRIAKSQAGLIAASVACVAVYSCATLAIPAGFGELIDHASRGEMPWATSWRLCCWFAVAGAGNFARLALVGFAGERVIAQLRSRLYRALMQQPAAFFDSPSNRTGALVSRLTMDTNVVGSSLTEALSQGAKNVLQMVGSIGVMMYFSPQLTAVIGVVLPPVAIIAGTYGRYVRKLQQQQQDAIGHMSTVAEERLGSIRTVKAFGRDREEVKLFNSKVERVVTLAKRMVVWNAAYVGFLHMSGYFTLYTIVWAGSMLVAANDLSAGTLFSFMLYTIYCGIGIMGVTNLVSELNKGYGASIRMFDVLDKADALAAEHAQLKGLKLGPLCQGRFRFDDVTFAYPARPETTVFRGLNLDLEPGKCTVVVGSSGGGKSSLAMLLLKLYDPSTGRVTLDDHSLAQLDTAWLRSIIGLVPQEPVLFGGTIAQNIAYGMAGRDWDEPLDSWAKDAVRQAAIKANAHDFIAALPQQYDTFVGESGRSLSGGQKQRIAIARALIKNPQLLVLDEATSALDSESEAVVQEALERIVADARGGTAHRSVLMFAHRLSMIRMADTVVMLKEGRVALQGSFDEVAADPHFRQLVGLNDEEEAAADEAKAEAAAPTVDAKTESS